MIENTLSGQCVSFLEVVRPRDLSYVNVMVLPTLGSLHRYLPTLRLCRSDDNVDPYTCVLEVAVPCYWHTGVILKHVLQRTKRYEKPRTR